MQNHNDYKKSRELSYRIGIVIKFIRQVWIFELIGVWIFRVIL